MNKTFSLEIIWCRFLRLRSFMQRFRNIRLKTKRFWLRVLLKSSIRQPVEKNLLIKKNKINNVVNDDGCLRNEGPLSNGFLNIKMIWKRFPSSIKYQSYGQLFQRLFSKLLVVYSIDSTNSRHESVLDE